MTNDMRTTLLAAVAMLAVASGFQDNAAADEGNNPFLGEPFFELQEIPCRDLATITVATDGTMLLFKDNRPEGVIEVRRSENGGKSWDEPVRVGELVKIEGDTFDDGGAKTWPVKRLVRKGPGGYTWLAAGRNGTPSEGMIYLYCINGYLARFNLSWVVEDRCR